MFAFALAVFLLLITPGPGVLSLAGVGTAYGCKKGIRYLGGLWIGNNLVSFAVISGLAALLLADPIVRNVLLFISATYLLFLASKIAFAGSKVAFIHMTTPGLVSGITLQLINPKAYAVHTMLFSGFVIYPESFANETGIKVVLSNLIWVFIHFCWLYAGVKVNELGLQARTQKLINLAMAICLVIVVILSVWSVLYHRLGPPMHDSHAVSLSLLIANARIGSFFVTNV